MYIIVIISILIIIIMKPAWHCIALNFFVLFCCVIFAADVVDF